jgi:hypothetical protein
MQLSNGYYQIGMGYSSKSAGAPDEALYVTAQGSLFTGLAVLDLGKKAIDAIGPFTIPLTGTSAELTGTGDGRLYGFFTTTPVQVAKIDPTSGGTSTPVPMPYQKAPQAWAFSFWGGHFYLYTSQGPGVGKGSDVTDYDPVSGSINTSYMTGVGFDIVGAGVSTCAPVALPQ